MMYLINKTICINAQSSWILFMWGQAHILICIKRITKNIINTQFVSRYKNIFAKGYVPNWSEEVFAITKVKKTVLWTSVISDFKGE